MSAKEQKIYRVFLTRHYIAVDYIEVKSTSPKKAANRAEKYIRKARPDVRAIATDNGWIADEPVILERIGQFGKDLQGIHSMVEADKDLFIQAEQ